MDRLAVVNLLDDLRAGKIKRIAVWRLDRLRLAPLAPMHGLPCIQSIYDPAAAFDQSLEKCLLRGWRDGEVSLKRNGEAE